MKVIHDTTAIDKSKIPNPRQVENTENLLSFCKAYENTYIFGQGEMGKALRHFLAECDVDVNGHVVSSPAEKGTLSIHEFRTIYQPSKTGLLLGVGSEWYHEIIPALQEFMDFSDVFFVSEGNKRSMSKLSSTKENLLLEVIITFKCNYSCAGCTSCSPLAKDEFMDFEVFKRDVIQAKPFFDVQNGIRIFDTLRLYGGEPMVHPEFMKFAEFARETLPTTEIGVFTNGLLLPTLTEDTVKRMAELNISVFISGDYRFKNLDMTGYNRLATKHGLNEIIHICDENVKPFVKHAFFPTKQVDRHIFLHCYRATAASISNFLRNGKISSCQFVWSSQLLNDYFGTSFEITENDYFDIYKGNREQLMEYLKKRKPFCSYHDVSRNIAVPHSVSKRTIDEWVLTDRVKQTNFRRL